MKSNVKLRFCNLLGQKIATLVNEVKSEGTHQVLWDASEYSSGIYFYKIEAGDFEEYRKCLLVN
ncbi:MAG: T9SS type A sorting domain-containing protein [Candidatus Marinimicrobia bacterium]|nr:T9SS type A sorting domain-containing protein [Candidatus Neomarinimicrobiota bacterium]